MKPPKKAVSLHDELQELGQALDALRVLAHLLAVDGFDVLADAGRAPRTIEALAAFLEGRLALVCRCLRGDVDPRVLLSPHNDATGAPPPEGWTDVLMHTRDQPGRHTK